ncbi:MAG: hypothetical protein VX294_06925 [Candidatus Latescibacterota bacterium]|nr:hypothetical protein [Candidatus Latescibacterota bacterium]
MKPQAIWHPQSNLPASLIAFRQRLTLSISPISALLRLYSSGPWVLYINGERIRTGADKNLTRQAFGVEVNIAPFLVDGDYEIIVKVQGGYSKDWFIAECEIIGDDNKRRVYHSGTSWQVFIDRAYQFDVDGQALTYTATKANGDQIKVPTWEKACIVEGPDPKNWDPINVEERETLPTAITELGEVDAVGPIDIRTTLESLSQAKFVHPEALLQLGKTEVLIQTRAKERAAYAVIDMGRVVYGCPRIRLRGIEGALVDLCFSLNRKDIAYTARYVCRDGHSDWIIPLAVSCRYIHMRVSYCPSEIRLDSLTIMEQVYDAEVKTKLTSGTIWTSYFDAGSHALRDARRGIYIDHASGNIASGLHAFVLGLNDIYQTGSAQTLGAMLSTINGISSKEECAALALCAIEYVNHVSGKVMDECLSVVTDGIFHFSSLCEDVPAHIDMLTEAACEKLRTYYLESGDLEIAEKLMHEAKVARSRYLNHWSIENGIIERKNRHHHDACWADSFALYFQLVENSRVASVVMRLKDFHLKGEDLWLAFFQAGALWRSGQSQEACSVIEDNWGRLLQLTGRTWSERANTFETLPGPDALIGYFHFGIRSIAALERVIEVRPSVQSLERAQAELTVRNNVIGVNWSLNGSGYLLLEVEQSQNSELRLAVPRLGKRFPTITINGETVWRNEKVYNNFQVQEVVSESGHVVFVVYKAGTYKVELSA